MVEQREKKYLDIIDTLVLILDNEGKVNYINKKGQEILGYTENELVGKNWIKMCIPGKREEEVQGVFDKVMIHEKKVEFYNNSVLTKDGKIKLISWNNSNLYDNNGNIEGVLNLGYDITQQDKIQRLFNLLSKTSLLFSTVKNEEELYQKLCDLIIQFEDYHHSYFGLVEYDEEKTIRPIAHAGYSNISNIAEKDIITDMKGYWSITEQGPTPPGKVIRTQRYFIENDLSSDLKFKSNHKILYRTGMLSIIMVPIILENIVIGVLAISSDKKNTFDEDDIEIITEMVKNLSLVIAKMRYYKIQRKNEEELNKSVKKFTTIFKAIPDIFFLISKTGEVIEFYGDKKRLYIPLEKIIGNYVTNIYPGEISEKFKENAIEIIQDRKPQIIEIPITDRNNEQKILEARMLYYDEEKIAVFVRNISRRKARERKLVETEERLRNINLKLEQKVKQRTKELENTKDQLNLILNSLDEPVFVISDEYKILFHNSSSSKIFDEILVGQKCYKVLKGREHPCDELCPLKSILLEQNIKSIKYEEKLFFSRLNEERDIEIRATVIEDFNGTTAILEIFDDITERKKKEKKIQESEFMLQVRVKEFKSLYGISSLLVVPNITIKELLYGVLPMIRSSWQHPDITMVKIIYGEYRVQTNNYIESQWRLAVSDEINGKILNIEVSYNTEKKFLYEESRLLKEILTRIKLGIISIEYKTEMKRLANIIETSSDGILSTNLNGIIQTWNKSAERIYGYTREEVLGKSINILAPPDRLKEFPNIKDKIKKGESYELFETIRLRKDGTEINIYLTISPILDLKGEIVGISSISRDVTESLEQQRLYQEQLIKSSQFKSDFMASMSHELRTPLNSIIGFTEVLLEKFYGDINEKQDLYLSNVKTSAEHLLHLINDILDISKIEAGKAELNFRDFNLFNLVSQVKSELKPLYKGKKLKFNTIGIKKGSIIHADPTRFKEILLNLLNNAIKYTKKGWIKLDFTEDKENWNFKIIDTGIGIAKDDFSIIFKEFKRVKSDYVNTIEGTGLGLMLTKKLIELHGGHITFTSKLGEGSTFSFTIPKKI
jgi:PAS domain S-box-containing protein